MRKAAATLAVGCSFALLISTLSHGAAFAAEGAVAQARRLIEAGDHAAAAALLEDALLETEAKDRPTIVQLLRQSYTLLAKRAEVAGRQREAAHYRDNLAILNRDPEPAPRSRESAETPKLPSPAQSAGQRAPASEHPATAAASLTAGSSSSKQSQSGLNSALADKTAPDRKTVTPSPTEPNSAPPAPAATQSALDPLPEPAPMPDPSPRKNTPASPRAGSPAETPLADSSHSPRGGEPATALHRQDAGIAAAGSLAEIVSAASIPAATTANERRSKPAEAASREEPKTAPAKTTVEDADRLYLARNFREAGKRYAELARESRLPAARKEHWGYCRYVALVEWINRKPRSQREWDQILEEIGSIERLAPRLWCGEYLRNKVAEVRREGAQGLSRSDGLVVRGSEPDDTQPRRLPRLFGKAKSRTAPQPEGNAPSSRGAEQPLELPSAGAGSLDIADPQVGQAGAAAHIGSAGGEASSAPLEPLDVDTQPSSRDSQSGPGSTWQIHETANFRIFHRNARLAESAGEKAEATRAAQAKKWGSQAANKPWTPACEIYLYPDGKALAEATQQPESSPGFSTMTSNGAQVVARRVNLRADHPQLLAAILPHEVTHVVLADIFTAKQIPRWADEGIAVLAEPRSEQQLRCAELQDPLESGRLFDVSKLMGMDYPEPKDWSLYYAQSVSLTRFLVELNSPERFIRFVLDSHRNGPEAALADAYQIKGFAALHERWKAYARREAATLTASAGNSSSHSSSTTNR
jgi:hypothetical protein